MFLPLLLWLQVAWGAPIGIDLGTTLSVVSVWRGSTIEIVPGPQGERLIPSEVNFDENGALLVGVAARQQRMRGHPGAVYQIKRVLGHSYDDPAIANARASFPFELTKCTQGALSDLAALFGWGKASAVGSEAFATSSCLSVPGLNRQVPVEFVSAAVLRALRQHAEAYLGEPVTEAVISTPAYFTERQKKATLDAAAIAGLKVIRLIPEPTAAALAFGQVVNIFESSDTLLVFDFGGGTFDISVLKREGATFTVLGIDGDSHLGGADIDELVCKETLEKFFGSSPPALNARQRARLLSAAEAAKIQLSFAHTAEIQLDGFHNGRDLLVTLSRARFELLLRPILDKLERTTRKLLETLKVTPSLVLLVGGSSRIPCVRALLVNTFGFTVSNQVHPDEAVGIGAGVLAAHLTNTVPGFAERGYLDGLYNFVSAIINGPRSVGNDERLATLKLIEVTAHSLGTAVKGDGFSPIVPRHSAYPGNWSHTYTTTVDYQTAVDCFIYEGEEKVASKNKLLNRFELSGIERAPSGIPQIDVRFSIDSNGVLHVTATDRRAGVTQGISVESVKWSSMNAQHIEHYRKMLEHAIPPPRNDEL